MTGLLLHIHDVALYLLSQCMPGFAFVSWAPQIILGSAVAGRMYGEQVCAATKHAVSAG